LGKLVRGANEDSSFHLATPDKAVKKFSVSVRLELGAPTISAETEGIARRLILDTSSNVSIMQSGISTGDVRLTPAKPYGVTGKNLEIAVCFFDVGRARVYTRS